MAMETITPAAHDRGTGRSLHTEHGPLIHCWMHQQL